MLIRLALTVVYLAHLHTLIKIQLKLLLKRNASLTIWSVTLKIGWMEKFPQKYPTTFSLKGWKSW
jgi:hypothetical protein